MSIRIPVAELEFSADGQTLWVHGPRGSTVLRIKTLGRFIVTQCDVNPSSHCDIVVNHDVAICLADDAVED